jgi:hypothetical protein
MVDMYLHFANCPIIKGYLRSAIYDLQYGRIKFIPNEYAELIIENNFQIELSTHEKEFQTFIREKLLNEQFGILLDKESCSYFTNLSSEFDTFSKVTNAVIELSSIEQLLNGEFDYFNQFEGLLCKDFQIIFTQKITQNDFERLFELLNFQFVNSIQLLINFDEYLKNIDVSILDKNPKISSIVIYNSPLTNDAGIIKFIKNDANKCDEIVSKEFFNINLPLFNESQLNNTYFNRKMSITKEGLIKNCITLNWNYGNVKEVKLLEALSDEGNNEIFFKRYDNPELDCSTEMPNHLEEDAKPAFKALFDIHKGLIDVCKICEFRNLCVDQCLPIQRDDGSWFRSKECVYNPYIAKWNDEEGYVSLSECGVVCNRLGFSIDNEKIEKINTLIWGL